MLNFLDVYERAVKGPIMSENDFDMKVFIPCLKKVVDEYGIRYDRENPVPSDDDVADNVFHAAVDFLSQVGVYCNDTNRVIRFSKEEILEAVKAAPGQCLAGEGRDAGVFGMRKPDDRKFPWFHVGSGIVATSEELATNLIEGYGSIPEANSISIPALDSIRGIPVMAGSPAELYAAIRAIEIGREALRRAGRPGLPIFSLISSATAAVTTIAASAPQFGLRPSDGWVCGTIAEMKVEFGTLNKVAYLLNWGANFGSEAGPILGGLCGGAAGTAVVSVAYILVGLLVHKANFHHNFPIHLRYTCSTPRDVLWAVSVGCQAGSRNIAMPVAWTSYAAAGPNTKMFFYETAAFLLCQVTSGAPGVKAPPHPAKGVMKDGITPMEAKFAVEIGKAACRLKRDQANDLVNRLLEKYESKLETAPEGSRYQECYDVTTGKPSDAYVRLYDEIKEELAGMGIPFE
jgi:methylamine--corrinoid protein Co-methyltransferase